jgi:hypothetical protein
LTWNNIRTLYFSLGIDFDTPSFLTKEIVGDLILRIRPCAVPHTLRDAYLFLTSSHLFKHFIRFSAYLFGLNREYPYWLCPYRRRPIGSIRVSGVGCSAQSRFPFLSGSSSCSSSGSSSSGSCRLMSPSSYTCRAILRRPYCSIHQPGQVDPLRSPLFQRSCVH